MVKYGLLFLTGIHSVKFILGEHNSLCFFTSFCVYQDHLESIPTKGVNLAMKF